MSAGEIIGLVSGGLLALVVWLQLQLYRAMSAVLLQATWLETMMQYIVKCLVALAKRDETPPKSR